MVLVLQASGVEARTVTRRAPLLLLLSLPVALAVVGAADLRMPEALRDQPPPLLSGCDGDIAGTSPVHYRYEFFDGTMSGWLPLDNRAYLDKPVASQTVRDGLGRTTTVNC